MLEKMKSVFEIFYESREEVALLWRPHPLFMPTLEAMRKGLKAQNSTDILGTVDEELWDVIYYALAIANIYDIDIEQVAKVKSEMNESRYPSKVKFEEGR